MKFDSINLLISLSIILSLGQFGAQLSQAQHLEECFWECSVEYCDYLDDYCNYDCHEICYPITKKSPISPFEKNTPNEQTYKNQLQTPISAAPEVGTTGHRLHDQLAVLNREQTFNIGQTESGRIGKHVKMRLENPAYETVRRGKVVLTRGSPPRGFAMFQDCLSGKGKANKQPESTSTTESSQQTWDDTKQPSGIKHVN